MVDYLGDLAANQGIDLQGNFNLRFDTLQTQLSAAGHNLTNLSPQQRKIIHEHYGDAVGEAIETLQETSLNRPGRTIFGTELDNIVLKLVTEKINNDPKLTQAHSIFEGQEKGSQGPKTALSNVGKMDRNAIKALAAQQQNTRKRTND